MLIRVLHEDPEICAVWHPDGLIVSTMLRITSVLCTVLHVHGRAPEDAWLPISANEPWVSWASDHDCAWTWLTALLGELNLQWGTRFLRMRNHKAAEYGLRLPRPSLPATGSILEAPRVVHDDCLLDDVEWSYRWDLALHDPDLGCWTKEPPPWWPWETRWVHDSWRTVFDDGTVAEGVRR